MSYHQSDSTFISSSYGWFVYIVQYIRKMGCGLFKPSLVIEGEKYNVLKEIGEGGFSTIELAENNRTKQKVAIKRITCHSIEDQNAAKFEIEVHKKHPHENILELLGSSIVGEADIVHNLTSEAFLVLPFYPSGTLHDLLVMCGDSKPTRYLKENEVLRLLRGISYALRELHSANPPLAHRDIKPQNVLLEPIVNGGNKHKNNNISTQGYIDY